MEWVIYFVAAVIGALIGLAAANDVMRVTTNMFRRIFKCIGKNLGKE